jgi:hypothetical protein
MTSGHWLRALFAAAKPRTRRQAPARTCPALEVLEDRALPSVTFSPASSFTAGRSPGFVALGDLNGDGKPDLAVTNQDVFPSQQDGNVEVLLNTTAPGATSPSFAARQDFPTGPFPNVVVMGDVNGDGKPDLIVANGVSDFISVLLNTTPLGATSFSFSRQDFTTGPGPISVALGDVNGDGKLDLVVANGSASTVSVLLNTTPPGATSASFSRQDLTFPLPSSVALVDVNGDGKPDLAVASELTNNVAVLLNMTPPGASSPSFASRQDFPTGTSPAFLTPGDVNGDGKLDLVVVNVGSDSVSVLLNTTPPGATSPSFSRQDFSTGALPISLALGDINGDGTPDLVVANGRGLSLSVLLNTTPPGATSASFSEQYFTIPVYPFGPLNPNRLALGDVNGDGKPDLALTVGASGIVVVLLNQSTMTTTTSLSGPTSSTYDQTLTYTATVSAGANPVTAGTVTFLEGSTVLAGPLSLDPNGQASFSISTLPAGMYTLTATYSGTADFAASTSSIALTVQRATPTLTWANPANIRYGTALGSSQLNATADVPGTFVYTPPAGTILNAGDNQTLSVTFTPSDTADYTSACATVPFTVALATLTVTANDQTKISGEANPTFTAGYSGFVLGEGPGVLGGTLTFNTLATTTSPPGVYAITPAGLTSSNYDITFVGGNLTVLSDSEATNNLVNQVSSANIAPGIQNALVSILQAATDSFNRGNNNAGINQLQAFEHHVSAQSGQTIDAAVADALIAYAQRIITAVG